MIPCTDETVRRIPWELLPQLPPTGGFKFPEPWNTYAARISINEPIEPVGYSYWRNINAHKDRDFLSVMLAFTYKGPAIFNINKNDGSSQLIRMLDIPHTGEGLYFSAHNPDILYGAIDNVFYRFNIITGTGEEIFHVGSSYYLWQCNSNRDETVHSATLRNKDTYEMLGAIVLRNGKQQLFPKIGEFDECQIDHSGRYLLIKETYLNGSGESNRIIDLDTGKEQVITNKDGAVGHSDMGDSCVIGEVDVDALPNCVEKRDLTNLSRTIQYHGTQWTTGVGHISHTNAGDFIVISNGGDESIPRQAEIIQVPLDGSQTFRALAPSMSSGGNYRNMPKGNLCPYGEYFIWTAAPHSDKLDAFILKV